MRRRSVYVAVAVVYAVAVYVALALAGSRADSVEILALVIAVSVAAGIVAWRFATNMDVALRDTERSREELALIGRLSAGLSGPLSPTEVATACLELGRRELHLATIVAVTNPSNRASQHVLEKVGLVYERDFTHEGARSSLFRTR